MKRIKFLFILLIVTHTLIAQNDKSDEQKPIPNPEVSTTQQKVTINGKTISLTAKAGTMTLRDENNDPIALFGFTSYTKNGAEHNRPIMFAYNGGPGSSSFWLHMGVLGPKRIPVNDGGYTPASPYALENNNYSILDIADLVMMDPVGTGLSVPVGKAEFKDFWGVDQDIRSISLFITQYLIQNGRMNSPKFLLGESYGTFRNAGVMDRLLRQGIALNGVIMVSAVFDLRTLIFPPDDDLPYIVHFPTYAATSWYHNRVVDKGESIESFLNGYYDLATVFYGVEHSINHLGLPKEIKDNIIMKYYEAGHMMYTHQPSLEKFKEDVGEFIELCNGQLVNIRP